MRDRESKSRISIWVRIPVIVALVLVGILVSSMLLGAADIGRAPGSGHGSGGGLEMTDHGGSKTGQSGGGHSANDEMEATDHGSSTTGGSGEGHDNGAQTGGHG